MRYIVLGSNDGFECEVLAIEETKKTLDVVSARKKYSIVASIPFYNRLDGSLPEIGHKFTRPADAPIKNEY